MSERVSIEAMVLELQKLMREKYAAGVSARLESDPPVVVQGAEISLYARIVAPATALAELPPVLRCSEVARFGAQPFEERERGPNFRDYAITVQSERLKPDNIYHFTLHPYPNAAAMAQCTVHVFRKGVVAAARRQLRDVILGSPRRKAAPSGRRRR